MLKVGRVSMKEHREALRNSGSLGLTKRHFRFIQAVVAQIPDKSARLDAALLFCNACHASNPKFSRRLFLLAVGISERDIHDRTQER
jgi:hypothetical protein